MSWRAPALMLVLVAALYVAARPWIVDTFGAGGLVATVIGTGVVVGLAVAAWQARRRRYACPGCGHLFAVSLWGNLVGQNWFGRLRAKCPACGEISWCDPVAAPD